MNVTVEELKQDPDAIVHRVLEGETLVVTEHDRPIAAGTFVVPDDFDDPLPEEILRDFEQ